MGWSEADIPDSGGRTAVVTGANVGLGFEVSRALAGAGATVLMACRDMGKARVAAEGIREEVPDARVDTEVLDLASLDSVREFASATAARFSDGIDLLINNAGVMMPPRRETADGFELQFGTNHLGHFALTGLLMPQIKELPGSRVVTVSSTMARVGRIDFDDLQGESGYSRTGAYGLSKLANLSFAIEFQRRLALAGSPIESMAAHPGYSATNLQKAGPRIGGGVGSALAAPFMALGHRLLAQDAAAGAAPILFAATNPELPAGSYVGPDGPGEMRGSPTVVHPVESATDREVAERLWSESERLTGVSYGLPA
ncbi:MAG: SDR family NAD(P)-dependent oxidoreductase [Solirubrobacterales bacterium]|nr:SDR family NAD(P)-dependent oxidoreductase [Solirubrobacterales bacterium]